MLALARNIPQAHASLTARQVGALASSAASRSTRRRSACSASAASASSSPPARRGFGMRVVAFDPFVAAERFRELGRREGRDAPTTSTRRPTSSRSTCPRRPRRAAGSNAEAFAQMQGRRAGHQLRARRADRSTRRSRTRSTPARSPAPRSTSSRASRSPTTRCSRYPNVVVTPHLGASTDRGAGPRRRADRRAGRRRADRRRRLDRGEHPRGQRRGHGGARPVPAARAAGSAGSRWRSPRAPASSASRSSTSAGSPSATRACSRSPSLNGVLAGHTEEEVNLVNAPVAGRGARDRRSPSASEPHARDFTDLVRVTRRRAATSACASSARRSAAAPPAPARGLGPALQPPARRRRTSRCSATPTCPGMVGRVGTVLRRARRQHLRRRGRPPAAGRGRPPRRRRGDGGHHRRAGAARGRRRDRRAPTASSPAARSRCRLAPSRPGRGRWRQVHADGAGRRRGGRRQGPQEGRARLRVEPA